VPLSTPATRATSFMVTPRALPPFPRIMDKASRGVHGGFDGPGTFR